MKRWLDRYVAKVPVKGGYMNIRPQMIIITSNYHPRDIWEDEMTYKAIERRCKIVHFPNGPLVQAFKERLVEANPVVESVLGKRQREEDLKMMGVEEEELMQAMDEGIDEDSIAMQKEEELTVVLGVTTDEHVQKGVFIDSFGIERPIGHLGVYAPGFRPNK